MSSLPSLERVPAGLVYPFEAACAVSSTFLVAPFIAIIDAAIFSNASGKQAMWPAITTAVDGLLRRPATFFRSPSFRWIWFVYGGTYIVANCAERALMRAHAAPDTKAFGKFAASSAANVSLSLLKDRAFSRMYGTVAPKPVPAASLMLFATRDSMTIAGSFNMPSVLSESLQKNQIVTSKGTADTLSQLFCPIFIQLFNTPLHLLGMDLYNNPAVAGLPSRDRAAFIRREYTKTLLARWGRIFPAFGIGGVANKWMRTHGGSRLEQAFGSNKATMEA